MKRPEIAKASEIMKRKTEACDSHVYMSVEWLFLCGTAYGIEEIMLALGYEWDGSNFVEVSHD